MIFYRIASPTFIEDLTGEGARIYGGRWNTKGTPALYMATSVALAFLEKLVHLKIDQIPDDFHLAKIDVSIEIHHTDTYPPNWNQLNPPQSVPIWGSEMLKSLKAFYIPSIIVPDDFNVVINPDTAINSLKIIDIRTFQMDNRIKEFLNQTT